MGADYIPKEHLLGKINSSKRRQLLEDANWLTLTAYVYGAAVIIQMMNSTIYAMN